MKGSHYPYIALVKKLLTDRRVLGCLAILLATSALVAPTAAHAGIWDGFANAVVAPALSIAISGIAWFLNWVSVVLLLLAVTVLKTIMAFVLQAAYTPLGAGPGSSIAIAWGVIRDFSNMLFILILIAIGVGTMLMNFKLPISGQQGVGPGLLVKFAIVAALINFTPVLTGAIIDISNILTKFFFDVAAGGANAFITFNPFTQSAGDLQNGIFNLDVAAGLAVQYGVAFIFNLVASLVLFTVAALLAVRVLALWLLVIFSPLAFAASILPQTQSIFKDWWNHFLQWVILPVPIGLFLWIAALILSTSGTACGEGGMYKNFRGIGTNETSGYGAPVNNVLQGKDGGTFCMATMSTMALGTVIAGMMAAFSVSAKGSGFIVSRAQGVQQETQKWANRRRVEGQQAVGRAAVRKARDGVSIRTPGFGAGALRQREATIPGIKNMPSKLVKGAGLPVVGGALGAVAAGSQLWLNNSTKKELDVEETRYKGLTGAQLKQHLQQERNPRRVAILSKLLGKEDNDGFSEVVSKNKELETLIDSLRESAKSNVELAKIFKDVTKKNIHLVPDADKEKAAAALSPKDISALPIETWKDSASVSALLRSGKINQSAVKDLARNPQKALAFRDGVLDTLIERGILTPTSPMPTAEELRTHIAPLLNPAEADTFAASLETNPVMQVALRTARSETREEERERVVDEARDAARDTARETPPAPPSA